LLGGKRTLSGTLNQAFELEATDIAVGTPSMLRQLNEGTFGGRRTPPHQETRVDQCAGPVGSLATSGVTAPTEGTEKTTGAGNETKELQTTRGNQ
jgi:hypothetical protein